jgi:formyltetrahydrofolate deformylase
MEKYLLKISCKDKPGIISMISGAVAEWEGNITELDQFTDPDTQNFFLRLLFTIDGEKIGKTAQILESVKQVYNMNLTLREEKAKKKTLILCSKEPHCLIHLLEKQRQKAVSMDITNIISNHSDLKNIATYHNIPFHHLPVTLETKALQEAQIEKIIEQNQVEFIILARYMQILSKNFCEKYKDRIINIHHSFLPGFKGANPYKQAYERGVKIIGATAHFVTEELDEGPIICQETIRVSHQHTISDLTRFGADIESLTLARAVKYVCEDKVFIDKNKTVVLK